jgi:UDP-N-acetylmuramate-alanine ligase
LWQADAHELGEDPRNNNTILDEKDELISHITLAGEVNRKDAFLVAKGLTEVTERPIEELIDHLNAFPGVSRRFEEIRPGLYTDYAHTPPKITGALQLAREVAGEDVVVVYEGLHNTRQHSTKLFGSRRPQFEVIKSRRYQTIPES